jgi:hypothetical protein
MSLLPLPSLYPSKTLVEESRMHSSVINYTSSSLKDMRSLTAVPGGLKSSWEPRQCASQTAGQIQENIFDVTEYRDWGSHLLLSPCSGSDRPLPPLFLKAGCFTAPVILKFGSGSQPFASSAFFQMKVHHGSIWLAKSSSHVNSVAAREAGMGKVTSIPG